MHTVMSDPLFLKDNTKKVVSGLSDVELSALNSIANKTIGDLKMSNDNLLVYSNNQKDKIEEQTIFNLYSDNSLCTTNLVGFIGVNDLKINIGSRFSEDEGQQYFIQYMLQRIHKLNLLDFHTTHDNTNIWEQILYLIFPIFLKKAYRQGIFKIYQKRHYNDSNIKGKIEIAKHLKHNLLFDGNVAYSNKELSLNNPTTQLIRHAIEYISSKGFSSIFYSDYDLNNAVQIIKSVTTDYNIRDRQKLILQNYKRVNHPFFTEYEPLRKICIQILNKDGLSFSNNQNQVYGLLIDAAWLWEEYLNTILNDLNFMHTENNQRKGALKLFARNQDIYPDFYNLAREIVIDAKYKKLQDENKMNREDIYQVITYMYRLQSKYGVLLYPNIENKITSFNMNEVSYGGNEALFIKYGMKVPNEKETFQDYLNDFKYSEEKLTEWINLEQYNCVLSFDQ